MWRIHGMDFMRKAFKRNGLDPQLIYDLTPLENHHPYGETRGREILSWLATHIPSVEKWVAIDDDSFDMGAVKESFVHTNTVNGLTLSDAQDAVRLLGVSVEPYASPRSGLPYNG